MRQILGKKQSTNNSVWAEAASQIEELVTLQELNEAVATVIDAVKKTTEGKRSAYAWSGGKDSLVLADICQGIGITDCVFAHTELEYPAFLAWCMENKPDGCEVINTGQDIEWLAKHPKMIFPGSSATTSRWYEIVQRTAIRKYFQSHNLDIIICGHRKADGNHVGKGTNVYTNGAGVTRYSPLADWPHELVLAYIHYHGIPMPPIYGWKDGYRCGTHPWPSRMGMASAEQGFREVYEIDSSIIVAAAEKLPSARHFLEGVTGV